MIRLLATVACFVLAGMFLFLAAEYHYTAHVALTPYVAIPCAVIVLLAPYILFIREVNDADDYAYGMGEAYIAVCTELMTFDGELDGMATPYDAKAFINSIPIPK